ncbi:hypothetical protein A3A38_04120 [Candidatus Kaiserbacteria bacterium RIFCSPLOWO2_01_FULL_53_17]|uniref:Uncharacterized protein n=1 Tax=Candidatus Kaiserbacteria bacterium RIFCSPLOWO2_01_FULL_53_17 TaxID=1798511 RepID=A0A1F6EFT9_9BACT|nr:MAG: hypothetical protein A3A38_04120 [Candidatus Kaiserbacteria bacterium RIFCSPLOWO2_01_FULL_53_17]
MIKKITFETLSRQIEKIGTKMDKGFASVEAGMEKRFSVVAEDIADVKNDVADVKESVQKVDERLSAVENKVSGIYNVLTEDARKARELAIPRRVHELEEKVFKVSRHPKHLAL